MNTALPFVRFEEGQEMRISRIQIKNFRNFHDFDVSFSDHAVIVGENKIGKSNLLFAMQLVLDPSVPESVRQLRVEDFWDRLERPLTKDEKIEILIELADFEDDEDQLAVLAEHLVLPSPMTARLTLYLPSEGRYRRRPKESGRLRIHCLCW
jgi:putative ATP-dependent endonuclease of OLD family